MTLQRNTTDSLNYLLVAVYEHDAQLGGNEPPAATFHSDIVARTDVLNVYWNAGILE